MGKSAVFFPGIGYTVDKPLMHYSRRIAAGCGYEITLVSYTGFPKMVRGNAEKLRQCYSIAAAQARAALSGMEFPEDTLFIGKSIGTAVAAELAPANARFILYTPLPETFRFGNLTAKNAVVFTGADDPWVAPGVIPSLCAERGIPCHVIPHGNHSLESGDWAEDIRQLGEIMRITEAFIVGA